MKELISKKQLAATLNISTRKIDEDIKKGMPHFKLGTAVRFYFDEVMNWYSNQECKKKGG